MTLTDKFEQWFINDEEDEHYEGMVELVAIEHAKIADEHAIDFARWILAHPTIFNNGSSMEQAIEIYKKEKGL